LAVLLDNQHDVLLKLSCCLRVQIDREILIALECFEHQVSADVRCLDHSPLSNYKPVHNIPDDMRIFQVIIELVVALLDFSPDQRQLVASTVDLENQGLRYLISLRTSVIHQSILRKRQSSYPSSSYAMRWCGFQIRAISSRRRLRSVRHRRRMWREWGVKVPAFSCGLSHRLHAVIGVVFGYFQVGL